jgi:methyltransferase
MSISDPFSGTPADPAEASSPLDPDQTDRRTAGGPKATILHGDALTVPELDGQSFDLITCVAALHHMPLEPALLRMRELLAPGGRLRIVGLAANASAVDWIVSAALLVPVRLASAIHRESRDIGVPTSHPRESLREIRAAVARLLPGCRIRRRFYYRYTIAWDKPRAQPEPQNRPDP